MKTPRSLQIYFFSTFFIIFCAVLYQRIVLIPSKDEIHEQLREINYLPVFEKYNLKPHDDFVAQLRGMEIDQVIEEQYIIPKLKYKDAYSDLIKYFQNNGWSNYKNQEYHNAEHKAVRSELYCKQDDYRGVEILIERNELDIDRINLRRIWDNSDCPKFGQNAVIQRITIIGWMFGFFGMAAWFLVLIVRNYMRLNAK